MIINCPKCGFSQPKDRYCANCGVDMEAFRPKEIPLSSRILKSWMFQAAVLIIAIATALSFLQVQSQRDTEDFADLAPPLPQQTTLEAPPPPPPVEEESVPLSTPPPTVSAPTPATAGTPRNRIVNLRNAAPSAPTAARPANARARARGANTDSVFTQIDLIYAEVPSSVVANLEAGSRMLDAGNVSAGVYPNIAPLLRQIAASGTQQVRGLRALEAARNLSVQINQPIITFKGTRVPAIARNIGITSQIIPTAMDDNGLHFQIEIQRTIREPGSATALLEFNYQAEISLTKGAGAFIVGLIPRSRDVSARAQYANAGVLKVMASPDFQQGFSEFVLFIEAR